MALKPLPGDPSMVASEASRMLEAADKMRRSAATLRHLAARTEFQGEAVDALRVNAEELSSVMTNAGTRYRGTGQALAEYAPKLEAAQGQARQAIARLGTTDVGHARADLARLELHGLNPLMSDDERARHDAEVSRAHADLAAQKAVEASALASYADAQADVERAASEAIAKIQDANEASGLNDSFWDDFKGFNDKYLDPIIEATIKVLDFVGDVLGIVGAILCFVPGLNAIGLALVGVGLLISLATLALTAFRALTGKVSWGEVAKKAIMTAIFSVLKVGKVAKGGLKLFGASRPGVGIVNTLGGTKDGLKAALGLRSTKGWTAIARDLRRGELRLKNWKYARTHDDLATDKRMIDLGGGFKALGKEGVGLLATYDVIPDGPVADVVVFAIDHDPHALAGALAKDAVGAAVSGGVDILSGALDGGTPWTTESLSTHDVSPIEVDFGSIDAEQITHGAFGSADLERQPVGAHGHSGGGGGGAGGGGW